MNMSALLPLLRRAAGAASLALTCGVAAHAAALAPEPATEPEQKPAKGKPPKGV